MAADLDNDARRPWAQDTMNRRAQVKAKGMTMFTPRSCRRRQRSDCPSDDLISKPAGAADAVGADDPSICR
jgi:hypothetical protein